MNATLYEHTYIAPPLQSCKMTHCAHPTNIIPSCLPAHRRQAMGHEPKIASNNASMLKRYPDQSPFPIDPVSFFDLYVTRLSRPTMQRIILDRIPSAPILRIEQQFLLRQCLRIRIEIPGNNWLLGLQVVCFRMCEVLWDVELLDGVLWGREEVGWMWMELRMWLYVWLGVWWLLGMGVRMRLLMRLWVLLWLREQMLLLMLLM